MKKPTLYLIMFLIIINMVYSVNVGKINITTNTNTLPPLYDNVLYFYVNTSSANLSYDWLIYKNRLPFIGYNITVINTIYNYTNIFRCVQTSPLNNTNCLNLLYRGNYTSSGANSPQNMFDNNYSSVTGGIAGKTNMYFNYSINKSNNNYTINNIFLNISYTTTTNVFKICNISNYYYNFTQLKFNIEINTNKFNISIYNLTNLNEISLCNHTQVEAERIGDFRIYINYTFINYSNTNSTNDTKYNGYANLTTLNNSYFNIGDNITFSARAYNDLEQFGSWKNSSTYYIYGIIFNNATFSNYINISAFNYTRNLNYTVNYICSGSNNIFYMFANNTLITTDNNLSCDYTPHTINNIYTHSNEGAYNISFILNKTNNITTSQNYLFKSDLYAPIVNISFNTSNGFGTFSTQLILKCIDSVMPLLLYNSTLNNIQYFYNDLTNGTTISNTTILLSGTNTALGLCSDFFSTTTLIYSIDTYINNMCLWDELDNVPFNINNVSSARLYFDSNSTYYDFKNSSTNCTNVTTTGDNKLRLDLIYNGGTEIVRYFDISLFSNDLKICANKQGVTHYEQLILSSVQRPVIIKSQYANCYIVGDYTRFSYQNAFLLKAYTINVPYSLFVTNGGQQVLLAGLDGSIQTYINIDTLEFNNKGYNLDIAGDSVSFRKTTSNTMQISYLNSLNDNTAISAIISRVDSGLTLASYSNDDFISKNNFTIYFDYTTIPNINSTTLFKFTLTKTVDGKEKTISRYFNTGASTATLPIGVAFTISVLLTIFGLTFSSVRTTFAWFGIMMFIASIAILSFTIMEWYVLFWMFTNIILLAFIIIVMMKQNPNMVA